MSLECFLDSLNEAGRQLEKLLRLQEMLRRPQDGAVEDEDAPPLRPRQSMELEARILRQYGSMADLGERLRRVITRLPSGPEQELLLLLYVRGLHPREAAKVMGYTQRHCYRIRQRALLHLEATAL